MQSQEIIILDEAANLHLWVPLSTAMLLELIRKKSEVHCPVTTLTKKYCDEKLYF